MSLNVNTSESTSQGFSLHVTVHIAPENVPKFMEAFQVAFDNITANKECEFFEVYTSPSEPGVLSWVEDWNASVEWLLEEHKKDYFKEYITVTEPMFLKPREAKLLQRAGPHLLVSRVACTNKA